MSQLLAQLMSARRPEGSGFVYLFVVAANIPGPQFCHFKLFFCWYTYQQVSAIQLSRRKQCSTVDQQMKGVFLSNLAMYHIAQGYIPCSGE